VPRDCIHDNLALVAAPASSTQRLGSALCSATAGFHTTACTPAPFLEKGLVDAAVR